ncbi:hypothetical protein GUJ93_ZPchr0001g31165 [Zizania palustris]|uniref:Uncharacterized protein n=1 Tax=Zizania palustris TaxID=103762 RepID=A0A8J5RRX3_ZIZPA|nr:hypothetical protein GUJ93_ZPchr0001g31165 [Zizania palustris]
MLPTPRTTASRDHGALADHREHVVPPLRVHCCCGGSRVFCLVGDLLRRKRSRDLLGRVECLSADIPRWSHLHHPLV